MKFSKCLVAIAAMTILIVSTTARAETLADTLTHAYNHSGLLDQNRALLRAADEDVAQAVASTLPVISWAANASVSSPRLEAADLIAATASISGQLIIYDNGAGQLGVEAQKELVLATRQSLRNIEQNILLDAVSAYMQVRADNEFVILRQNNVRVIVQEFRAAQDRFEVGEVTRTDVALAEARLAAARSLLAAAQGSLARSGETYRNAVGRSPLNLQPAQPAPVLQNIIDAKAYAVRNHPLILEVQHSVNAAELNIRRGEAAFRPTFTLNSDIGISQDGIVGKQIGINARGPIYSGGALSSQVRQLMARRDLARAQLHIVRLSLERQVGNAYSFLDVARASSLAINQQISAARVAFLGVREEAKLGARTTIDVLNAEQELLNAQADLIAAQSDEVIASYQVLATMGMLTAKRLRLPVQHYDPAAYYNLVKDGPTFKSDQGQALDRILQSISQ